MLSTGYRLGPEKHLNATHDDDAGFLREQFVNAAAADGWLAEAGNFGHVFVTGDSIDSTIAHHLTVLTDNTKHGELDLDPVTVWGSGRGARLQPQDGEAGRTAASTSA